MPYNRGNYQDKWRIERLATAVRGKLEVDQLEPLSPWRLADAIPAHIFYPRTSATLRSRAGSGRSSGTGSPSAVKTTRH